jgi:hypothetical protein
MSSKLSCEITDFDLVMLKNPRGASQFPQPLSFQISAEMQLQANLAS